MSNLYATSPASSADDSTAMTAANHTTYVAADQAGKVGDTAAPAAGPVANVTKDEVGTVAAETNKQAKVLLTDARSQLTEQAGEQQARVADGVATDLVRQAERQRPVLIPKRMRRLAGRAAASVYSHQ